MKKLLLTLLLCLIPSVCFGAIEDLTTYDIVDDAGTGTMTVTATMVSTSSNYLAETQLDYVGYDFGVGSIDAFKYNFEFTLNVYSNYSDLSVLMVSNQAGVNAPHDPAIHVIFYNNASTKQVSIKDEGTGNQSAISLGSSLPVTRYGTVERYGDVASLKIYTESDRSDNPSQVNINVGSETYRYLYAYHTKDNGPSDRTVSLDIGNIEILAAPTETPAGPPVLAIDHPYPADWDYKGGWTGRKSLKRKFFQETSDFIDKGVIYDSNANFPTTAVDGYNLDWLALAPDANVPMIFVIRSNTADTLFTAHTDRIEQVLIDGTLRMGDMEATGTMAWLPYNSPSTLEIASTISIFQGTKALHIVADSANDGAYQGTLNIDTVKPDCVTDYSSSEWSQDRMHVVGHAFVIDGTLNMQVIDGDGTISIANVEIGTAGGTTPNHWEYFSSGEFTTTNATCPGAGEIRFYFSSDTGEAYIDNVKMGQTQMVHGNNDAIFIDSYGDKFENYTVYHDWEPQYFADNKRWYLINPLGNVYFIKGVNNYDYNQIDGRTGDGYNHAGATYAHRTGSGLSPVQISQLKDSDIQNLGYTDIGFIASSNNFTSNPHDLFNRIATIDLKQNFRGGDGTAGWWETTQSGVDWNDVYDPDWDRQMPGHMDREGVSNTLYGFHAENTVFNSPTTSYNPYRYSQLRALADINIIGWNLGNEPAGSSSGKDNPMGRLVDPATEGTFATDSTNDPYNETYLAQLNWLRSAYGDPVTEGTFLTNIAYDGDYELSLVGSVGNDWTDVPGYDATDTDGDGTPDKDEDAMTALMTAWNSEGVATFSIPTERGDGRNTWTHFYDSWQPPGLVTGDPDHWGCDEAFKENNNDEYCEDVNLALANYHHRMQRSFYDYYFGPDGEFHERKLNFTYSHAGHDGWAKGLRVRADGKKIIRVWGGMGVGNNENGASYITPYRDQYAELERQGEVAREEIQEYYDWTGGDLGPGQGIPMMLESMWHTSGTADHYSRVGTIDVVIDVTGTAGDFRQGAWDCDAAQYGNIASYCDSDADTYDIAAQTTLYWNCSDPTDVPGDCEDQGTFVYQFSKVADSPQVHNNFSNNVFYYTDVGSVGNITDNDVMTTGTLMFTLNGAGSRRSALIDWDMNAYPKGFESPWMLANHFHTTTTSNYSCFRGENGHTQDSDPTDGNNSCTYVMLNSASTTPYSISGWKRFKNPQSLDGGDVGYKQDVGITDANFYDYNVGDTYGYGHMDLNANAMQTADVSFIMDTQTKRGLAFAEVLKQAMDFQATNGDYFTVGFSNWSIISDYGYADYSTREVRGFGMWTALQNKKDGIENDVCGYDGICGNWNDELQNHGDATTPFSRYLKSIYVIHD